MNEEKREDENRVRVFRMREDGVRSEMMDEERFSSYVHDMGLALALPIIPILNEFGPLSKKELLTKYNDIHLEEKLILWDIEDRLDFLRRKNLIEFAEGKVVSKLDNQSLGVLALKLGLKIDGRGDF